MASRNHELALRPPPPVSSPTRAFAVLQASLLRGVGAKDRPRAEHRPAPKLTTSDWHRVIWLGHCHGLLPAVCATVSTPECEWAPPPETLQQLEIAVRFNELRHLTRAREACLIHDLFSRAGIPVVFASGWALARRCYTQPSLRSLGGNTTLLVRPADVPQAEAVLAAAGYHGDLNPLKLADADRSNVLVRPFNPANDVTDPLLIRTDSIAVGGRELRVPAPADWLLRLCSDRNGYRWTELRRVADLLALLHSRDPWDWPRILDQAEAAGLRASLLFALAACHRIAGEKLPPLLEAEVSREPALDREAKNLSRQLESGEWTMPGTAASFLLNLRLQPRWTGRLRYAWKHLRRRFRPPVSIVENGTDDPACIGRFAPTPPRTVDAMLSLADVAADDVVYDLGCGDGRIVISAAKKYGARGIGIDLDPQRIREATEAAAAQQVDGSTTFRCADAMHADLKDATVVCIYLQGFAYPALRRKFSRELRSGTRIVSHSFIFPGWPPEKTQIVDVTPRKISQIFLWRMP